MAFYVYILASRKNGTLYVGSTDNLTRRVWQHKAGDIPGFTSDYAVNKLVWWEIHDTREGAFRRERQIKEWKRAWKVRLIEKRNLEWRDLYDEFLAPPPQTLPLPLIPAKAGTQDRLAEADLQMARRVSAFLRRFAH
jgi:putative endonuclease